jgi:hypothetical protein
MQPCQSITKRPKCDKDVCSRVKRDLTEGPSLSRYLGQTVPHVVELEPAGISDIALASVQQRSGQTVPGVVHLEPAGISDIALVSVHQRSGQIIPSVAHPEPVEKEAIPQTVVNVSVNVGEGGNKKNSGDSVEVNKKFLTACALVVAYTYWQNPNLMFKSPKTEENGASFLNAIGSYAQNRMIKSFVKKISDKFGGSNIDKNGDHSAHAGGAHRDVPGDIANSSRGKTYHKSPSQSPDISKGAVEGEIYDLEEFEFDARGSSSYDDRPFIVLADTHIIHPSLLFTL